MKSIGIADILRILKRHDYITSRLKISIINSNNYIIIQDSVVYGIVDSEIFRGKILFVTSRIKGANDIVSQYYWHVKSKRWYNYPEEV